MAQTKARNRDPDTTRCQALDAAQHLFAKKGFAGVSMREIAALSGVSQPLIHYHFGNKEGLYRAVKERLVADLRAVSMVGGESSEEGADTAGLIRTAFDFLSTHEILMRLVAWSHLEGEVTPWPGEEDFERATADHLRRNQSEGSMRKDIDPMIAAIMIQALVVYWCENRHYFAGLFDDPLETVTERYLNQAISLFLLDARSREHEE